MSSARRCFHGASLLALLAFIVAGCGTTDKDVVATTREPTPGSAADPSNEDAAAPAGAVVERSASGVLVDVTGLVRRPGVYRLSVGARVHEAISAAGGVRAGADLTSLNRAAPLVDGQQVLVPAATPAGSTAVAGSTRTGSAVGGLVSLNRADAAELDALPGIGPVTAERIVVEREQSGPFQSLHDLDRVPGIGPATIAQLEGVATT